MPFLALGSPQLPVRVRFIQVFPSKPSSVLLFCCLFPFFHLSSLCFLHFGETKSVLEVKDTP